MMMVSNIENQTHRYSRSGRPWKASSSMKSKELPENNLRSHGKNKTVSAVTKFVSLHIKGIVHPKTIS